MVLAEHRGPDDSKPATDPIRTLAIPALLVALGLALFAARDVWHEWVAEIVPHGYLSRTAGTTRLYGGFRDRGSAIAFGTSLVLLATGFTLLISPRVQWHKWTDRDTWTDRFGDSLATSEVAFVGGFFVMVSAALTWLGTPLDGRNNHTYIHWVRNVFSDDPLDLYVLPRLPHKIFYYHPGLLVFLISFGTLVALWLIARCLTFGRLTAAALAASFFLTGVVMFFVNPDEDVSLNFLITLAVLAAFVAGRSAWFGIMVVLAVATREQWTTLGLVAPLALVPNIVADVKAELARGTTGLKAIWAAADVRFLVQAAAVATPVFVVYLVIAEAIGTRAFFIDGSVFQLDPAFEGHSPRVVDGFKISAYSGAYVGRVFWMLPILSVGLAAFGLRFIRQMRRQERTVYLFCLLATVANVILIEARPLTHPQMRYLAYVAPFVIVGSWVTYAVLHRGLPTGHPVRAVLFVVVLLAPLTSPFDGIDKRARTIDQPGMSMMDEASQIADLRAGRPVLIQDGDDWQNRENLVGYVFQLERREMARVPEQGPPPGTIAVYFSQLDSLDPASVVWRGSDAVVVEAPR